MICLGSAGAFIGLLGLFLFRGYDHDHNIRHEIVEQKKNDFVRSVYATLHSPDANNELVKEAFIRQTSVPSPQSTIIPELVVTESAVNANNNNNNNNNIERKKSSKPDIILPSLNDTYRNAFVVADLPHSITEERISDISEQQLRVPNRISVEFQRLRSVSGDSVVSSTFGLNQDESVLEDEFQKSRVYATLHALGLHSLVNSFLIEKKEELNCSSF